MKHQTSALSADDQAALAALAQIFDLTGLDDWHLFHQTVRADVQSGKRSRDFEAAYKALVDERLASEGTE